jgi:hypothetical protein
MELRFRIPNEAHTLVPMLAGFSLVIAARPWILKAMGEDESDDPP